MGSIALVERRLPPDREVSFIIPAFGMATTLSRTIESIRRAVDVSHEVIVVDDGMSAESAAEASQLADRVISRPCQGGAARSRNDGAGVAVGRALIFVDSDVTVTPGAVTGALRHLAQDTDAVFGAYQPLPPPECANATTTFKHLQQHYVHLRGAGDADTFWSGFGAIRSEVFRAVGGFDVSTTNAADVEDIDLGYRLRDAGYRIVLDPTLSVRHHKRYRIRDLLTSDLFHRAVPWTRAIVRHRRVPGGGRLNLRPAAVASAVLSLSLIVTGAFAGYLGIVVLPAVMALGVTWLALNGRFLWFCRRHWGWAGMARSIGFLYGYYLCCLSGAGLGLVVHFLRHGRRSTLNTLDLVEGRPRSSVDVTVALIDEPGECRPAFDSLPALAPWWELLVVGPTRPGNLPAGARWLPAPAGTTRNGMYQRALEASVGEMFATLDTSCRPAPGWLDVVRATAGGCVFAVAGSFQHNRDGVRCRANQMATYWAWRPERAPACLADHPLVNSTFRTEVARSLGGFQVDGALLRRLATFGARPVRFEPAMVVHVTGHGSARKLMAVTAARARLLASVDTRYLDLSVQHRAVLVALSPLSGLLQLFRTIGQAVREGTADRTFWMALPLVAAVMASGWVGRDLGWVRPGECGGVLPHATDLEVLRSQLTLTAPK